jgi:hypothetical protein
MKTNLLYSIRSERVQHFNGKDFFCKINQKFSPFRNRQTFSGFDCKHKHFCRLILMSLQLGFPSCSFKSIFFLIKYIKKWDGIRVAHLYIVSQMTTDMFYTWKQFLVLSSYMTYHRVYN